MTSAIAPTIANQIAPGSGTSRIAKLVIGSR